MATHKITGMAAAAGPRLAVNAWIVRPRPHFILRLDEFLAGSVVAVGWPKIGDLTGRDHDGIRQLIQKHYSNDVPQRQAYASGQLNTFVNRMATGDYIVMPNSELAAVHFGVIESAYFCDPSKATDDEGWSHQRDVKWLLAQDAVPVSDLPEGLQGPLQAQQAVIHAEATDVESVLSAWGSSYDHTHGPTAVGADLEVNVPVAYEGQLTRVLRWHRSRENWIRQAKVRQELASSGRLLCEVPNCGFNFAKVYGVIGNGYAQVHHRKPLSTVTYGEPVTMDDLMIVCANCHVMIHRGGECRDVSGLIPSE